MSDNPFDGPQMRDQVYARADMAATRFDGVNLADAVFYAVLTNARFENCNMAAAVFDDVNLAGASLNNVNLAGVRISDANCTGLSIDNANLSGMRINGILVTELLDAYARTRRN